MSIRWWLFLLTLNATYIKADISQHKYGLALWNMFGGFIAMISIMDLYNKALEK